MTKLELVKKLVHAAAQKKNLTDVSVKKSAKPNKKYVVAFTKASKTHTVHFGHPDYKDYLDTADDEKRKNYLNRATKIRDGENRLTCNDPTKSNFWAVHVLWPKELQLRKH